jgi:hypothetical protein
MYESVVAMTMDTVTRYPMYIYYIRICIYELNILYVGLLLDKNIHPIVKLALERSALTHAR